MSLDQVGASYESSTDVATRELEGEEGGRPSTLRRLWEHSHVVLYPLSTVVLLLLAWDLAIVIFNIPPYLVPKPSRVLETIVDQRALLLHHAWRTITEILGGYALAILVGIPLAVAIVASRIFERMVYPMLVMSQTVPKIAIAPLLLVWFGFGLSPKILIAFLIAFFPIVIDTAVGLRGVPEEMLDLARSMGGRRLDIFRKIRFPHALPSIFGGLKVAITLAVIGAIVGEFVGADRGLGYLLLIASGRIDTTLLFGTIIVLSLLGIVAFALVDLLERLAIPWHTSRRVHG